MRLPSVPERLPDRTLLAWGAGRCTRARGRRRAAAHRALAAVRRRVPRTSRRIPFDLSAERWALQFQPRTHKFHSGFSLWSYLLAHDKRWLTDNTPWRAVFGDWQWSGDWTIASGLPFTPRLLGNIQEVNAGRTATLRPDVVPGQSMSLAHPSTAEWRSIPPPSLLLPWDSMATPAATASSARAAKCLIWRSLRSFR